jgi:hypothetical protein
MANRTIVPEGLDPRKVITGKDGLLLVGVGDNAPIPLANCDTFKITSSFNNTDLQPVGNILSYGIPTGITVSLSMTEIIIRDDLMLGPLLDAIAAGQIPWYDFQGKYNRRYDVQEERVIANYCIPDGDIDIMSLSPGEIVKREWKFRCNSIPSYQSLFS